MKIRKTCISISLMLMLPLWIYSQTESVDLEMVYRIKQEGSRNSKIEELAFGLTDFVGPRLTASTGNNRANEWAKKKMEELGFQDVRIEEASDFPRGGWDNLKSYAAMTAPYYANFACNPVAWTGSTNGLVKSDVVLIDVKSESDLEKYKGKLGGKIVLLPATSSTSSEISFEPLATRWTDEQLREMTKESLSMGRRRAQQADYSAIMAQRQLRTKVTELIKTEGAAVVINNAGSYNIPDSRTGSYTAGNAEPVAELNLPMEAAGRMERLIRNNVPVEMEVEIKNSFFASPKVYNVIGEIPGTDKILKNEVVLIGAHIDSYQGSTGAADNASGCIVMMEALRILKALNVAPKRTIRVALWTGEEEGFYGSRGYLSKYLVDQATGNHKPDFDKFAAYFNMDNGTGRYRGIYLQQNEMVRPIFEAWLKPFADLGCSTIAIGNTTGTDHQTFDRYGLPAFQFIQDDVEYWRTYHTPMDTYERLVMEDLKIDAIVTASFAYNAAMRNDKLPRKPVTQQQQGPRGPGGPGGPGGPPMF